MVLVNTTTILLILAAFLASAGEMVEALTIVLGVGVVRGWRSPLIGVAAAAATLAGLVVALGPALRLLPIGALRLVVGALLLAFGLQWLGKSILRASGCKPMHDEDEAYRKGATRHSGPRTTGGRGPTGTRSQSHTRASCSRVSKSSSSSSRSEAPKPARARRRRRRSGARTRCPCRGPGAQAARTCTREQDQAHRRLPADQLRLASLLTHNGIDAWWFLPLAVGLLLTTALWWATHRRRTGLGQP
ncbi:hypothetical protein DLE60_17400 [Micromonospora globispora]|nr:hypothetical protein DLE60_17400 [Micromonospora globispora]